MHLRISALLECHIFQQRCTNVTDFNYFVFVYLLLPVVNCCNAELLKLRLQLPTRQQRNGVELFLPLARSLALHCGTHKWLCVSSLFWSNIVITKGSSIPTFSASLALCRTSKSMEQEFRMNESLPWFLVVASGLTVGC